MRSDIERVFDAANGTLGPLTHFVHSSGIIGENSRLDEVSATTIREVLDVDTFGALLCLRACVRRMSTKHGGKGGAVVMLSSMAAPLGGANECVWYAAAKAGVDSMVIGVSREVAKEGMRVNAVTPGVIDTDIQPPGRVERVTPMLADGQGGAGRRSGGGRAVPAFGRCLLHQRRELARFGRALIRLALAAWLPMIAAEIRPHNNTNIFKE